MSYSAQCSWSVRYCDWSGSQVRPARKVVASNSIDPQECVPAVVPRLRGYLIAWVKVTAYRTSFSTLPTCLYTCPRIYLCIPGHARTFVAIGKTSALWDSLEIGVDNFFAGTPRIPLLLVDSSPREARERFEDSISAIAAELPGCAPSNRRFRSLLRTVSSACSFGPLLRTVPSDPKFREFYIRRSHRWRLHWDRAKKNRRGKRGGSQVEIRVENKVEPGWNRNP